MLRRLAVGLFAVPLFLVALSACSSSGSSTATTTTTTGSGSQSGSGVTDLTVGVSPSTASIPVYLAEQKYFAQQGLKVTLTTIQSGAQAVPELLNGQLNIALGDPVGTIQAAGNRVPLAVIGAATIAPTSPHEDYSGIVAASPGITTPADLAGKTVAVNQLNGVAELSAKAAIDHLGGKSSAVNFIELPFPEMVAAVKAGRVAAALVVEPYLTEATAAGLHIVLQPQAYSFPGAPNVIYVTSQSFRAKDSAVLSKFITAIDEAGREADDDPAAARAVAATYIKLPSAMLAKIRLPIFAENGSDVSGMNTIYALMNQYKIVTTPVDMRTLLDPS